MKLNSQILQPNRNPSPNQLRTFGWLLFGVSLFLFWQWPDEPVIRGTLIAGAATVAVVGSIVPRAIRPIYVGILWITRPIGIVVGEILMLLIYFGLIFPTAIVLRMLRHDELHLRCDREKASYWQKRDVTSDLKSYFRQF